MIWETAMKLPLSALILALCAAFAASVVSARPGVGDGLGRLGDLHFIDTMADRIGLTIDQEDAINALIDEVQLATAVDRERLAQLRDSLRRLSLDEEIFDSSTAADLAGEMAEIASRMAVTNAELRWNIRQRLTPEQRELIDGWRSGGRRQPPFVFNGGDPLTE
jgi:Spy/CpxP family protein refolding chaperone